MGLLRGHQTRSETTNRAGFFMGEQALQLGELAEQQRGERPGQEAVVLPASALATERWTRTRFRRWLGSLATAEVMLRPEAAEAPGENANLLDAIRAAREGDAEAERLVDINVGSAAAEACFKEGHVTRITMQRNEAGVPVQFGQTLPQIHYNSLVLRPDRHEKLQAITKAEALNGHRIEDAARAGTLRNYWMLVPSLVPEDDIPEKDLGHKGDGYFLESMTFVLQATTEKGGDIITESAFSAGVEHGEQLTYEERQAQRFDLDAIAELYRKLGQRPRGSVAEYIQDPLLIPKSMMPNGVVDVLRWLDETADELLGRNVVRTEQQYLDLLRQSEEREKSLGAVKRLVKKALLQQAYELKTPMDAVQRLWDLTRHHTVADAATNLHINPRVFGAPAAVDIMAARAAIHQGDRDRARALVQRAQKTAVITGCGGGSRAKETKASATDENQVQAGEPANAENPAEEGGVCEYQTDGCYCSKYERDGSPRKVPLTVTVYKDEKKIAHCKRCGAWLAPDGSKGEGSIKKRADGKLAKTAKKSALAKAA